MVYSPVKEVAIAHHLPVFQPENFREAEAVEQLRQLKPDLVAVVAYGRILHQRVLDIPTLGCVNIHASLLPQYRGKGYAQQAMLEAERIHGANHWELGTILEEKGNCYLYEKMGYHQTGSRTVINEKMTIVGYEKD